MEEKKTEKKRKGRTKIGFRGVILAMLIALLLFLGWDGMNLGDGEGVGTETAENGEDVEDESTKKNPVTDSQEGDELEIFSVYLVEERIYLDDEEMGAKLVETDLSQLEEKISLFDKKSSRIIIYDAGALSGSYEDVINLVKRYDLVFSEESISLEEDRF